MRPTLPLAALLLAGCLSHMPRDGDPRHLEIAWARDFEAAKEAARTANQPLLLVMVAGDVLDQC